MKMSEIGKAPDYRFTLANERTFLAWIRTSLGFLAGGVALDQGLVNIGTTTIRENLALVLYLCSLALAVYGYWRWQGNEKAMRLNSDLQYTPAQRIVSFTMGLIICIVIWNMSNV